jgi:23S rRNA-/tRNA-specific pseudouridylate synthase
MVEAPDEGLRLDRFLAAPGRLGSRARVAAALARGKVFLNDAEASLAEASRRLARGDTVRVWIDRPGSARPRLGAFVDGDLRVVHEDDDLIVVNKPAGILTVPLERRAGAPSVVDLLVRHWRSRKRPPLVVHRIDKALIQRAARANEAQAAEAVSRYRVVETFDAATLLEVRLVTGKQNQIRIQAQLRGHALVGERRYVGGAAGGSAISFGRQALHAHRLSFRHPADERPVVFEAPLPRDFTELLARLRSARGAPSRDRPTRRGEG